MIHLCSKFDIESCETTALELLGVYRVTHGRITVDREIPEMSAVILASWVHNTHPLFIPKVAKDMGLDTHQLKSVVWNLLETVKNKENVCRIFLQPPHVNYAHLRPKTSPIDRAHSYVRESLAICPYTDAAARAIENEYKRITESLSDAWAIYLAAGAVMLAVEKISGKLIDTKDLGPRLAIRTEVLDKWYARVKEVSN